jgi:hypothetical protein
MKELGVEVPHQSNTCRTDPTHPTQADATLPPTPDRWSHEALSRIVISSSQFLNRSPARLVVNDDRRIQVLFRDQSPLFTLIIVDPRFMSERQIQCA